MGTGERGGHGCPLTQGAWAGWSLTRFPALGSALGADSCGCRGRAGGLLREEIADGDSCYGFSGEQERRLAVVGDDLADGVVSA